MILYKKNSQVYYEDIGGTGEIRGVPDAKVEFDNHSADSQITISLWRNQGRGHKNFFEITVDYDQVFDQDNLAYGDSFLDVTFGSDRGIETRWQDQTTDDVVVKFNQVQESTTLASSGSIDDKTITLTSVTGSAAGKYIVLFHPSSERFSTFNQVGAAAGNVITLDSPLDFDYPAGTFVDIADTNLAVDGSSTTQIFGLRGTGAPPGVDINFHLTRIMISCLTTDGVSLSEFANIPALTHGLVFRSRNGRYHNSFNVKSNREIDAIFGTDWKPYASINPQQGQDGFTARLTFAGVDKIGVVKDLPIGMDYEVLVQDALDVGEPNSITLLEIYAEGHLSED